MARRERSKAYPVLTLREAEDALGTVRRELGTGAWDRDPVAQALGHAHGRGGLAARKVSALTQYGLLRRRNGRYSFTPLGDALVHPRDEEEHRQALREALEQPALFAALLEGYAAAEQVPRRLHHVLVRDHGITDGASGRAAEIFLRSARYAGVLDAEGRVLTPLPGAVEETPGAGTEPGTFSGSVPSEPAAPSAPEATREEASGRRGGEAPTQRFEIALGGGRRAVLELPAELRPRDLEVLRKQLEVLELQVRAEED
jgi:hypothetical protein